MSNVTIQGVAMTVAAAQVVEAVSVDVAADVRAIRSGEQTRDELLAKCLDGAEDESTREAWREYVSAVVVAAESTAYILVPAPGTYGDRATVLGAYADLDDAQAEVETGYVVRECATKAKGDAWLRTYEEIYPIVR